MIEKVYTLNFYYCFMTSENIREEQHNYGDIRGLRSKLADFVWVALFEKGAQNPIGLFANDGWFFSTSYF